MNKEINKTIPANIWENEDLNPITAEEAKQADAIQNAVKDMQENEEAEKNPFPVEVFPEPIQEIISATKERLKYPIDFIGASILYAVSVAIGNTHRVEIMKGWQESAVLYLSLVGRSGVCKSHPLDFALNPLKKRDNLKYQKYISEKMKYDTILSLSKKEREKEGLSEPIKPFWEQLLLSDFTPEALVEAHKFNKRGLGVHADELASWFKNFNRYNKGSEQEFWLTVWSGKPIRINRKTSEPAYIPLPFISVAGTIQTGILNELADNRTENGFLDRILFVIPDNLKKEHWSETEINPSIIENWEIIISNLSDIPIIQDENNNPVPEVLRFTPEAKELLFEWQRESTDQSNQPENESLSGIFAKLEVYAIRLALILQMMRYACNGNKQAIEIEAVQGALKLVEYFKKTAIKVRSILSNVDPLDKLPTDKQNLYKVLPDSFTTGEGVQIAENMGMAKRTFKRFLSNREFFDSFTRGEYEKRF